MGFCVAVNCGNNSSRKQKKMMVEVVFFCQSNEKMKKKWLINIRRETLAKELRMCHLHFEESCLEPDLEVIHCSVYFIMDYPLNRTFSQGTNILQNEDISLILWLKLFSLQENC